MLRFSKLYNLNPDVVLSIIKVESDFHPYTIEVNFRHYHRSIVLKSYFRAVSVAYRLGDNIDLGYMQVNYKYWGRKLGLTKADLLNPEINIQAGCYILYTLLKKYKSYAKAVRHYHSSNYYLGTRYMLKVARVYDKIAGVD